MNVNIENYLQYIEYQVEASIEVKRNILLNKSFLENISRVASVCIAAFRRGNRIILAGNGGSAADAQHIAAEFVSRFMFDRPGLPAIALNTDTSMLTAIGNDYGYENVFRRQLEANGRAGDVFFGITTSGNSPNVLYAIESCRTLKIVSVGLSGEGGKIQGMCEYLIGVPSTETPRIQEAHIMIGHIICGIIESNIFGSRA